MKITGKNIFEKDITAPIIRKEVKEYIEQIVKLMQDASITSIEL